MLNHTLKPILRAQASAHITQTMSLLKLNTLALHQKLEASLASNPALELVEGQHCPACGRWLAKGKICPVCSHLHEDLSEEPIVYLTPRDDFYTYTNAGNDPDQIDKDDFTPARLDLPEHILYQIAPELEADEKKIAVHIVTSLDDDGLLTVPILEIARYHNVRLSKVEKVLSLIQHADPVGVGSPSVQKALLVQLKILQESYAVPPLAERAIQDGFDLLSRQRYHELARLLKTTADQVEEIARFIGKNLNPYPARAYWGIDSAHTNNHASAADAYYLPDVVISHLDNNKENRLLVEIAHPINGMLRINPLFREALKEKLKEEASKERVDQWKSDLEQATLLVKCLQQRSNTLVRLLQILTSEQRYFILHGDEFLKPMTQASIAKELGVHEATVSRAVSDKAVQLPNGRIMPLSSFFDRNLHVRAILKQIIAKETTPLSDAEIGASLRKLGYKVARRTVAKYRAVEGIPPAHQRARQRKE